LALEDLTAVEQRHILQKNGVTDTQQFIREAERRELSDFLINPQNLKMLAEVVLKKGWPTTRWQLFEDTTVILLKEHNRERVRTGAGNMWSMRFVRPQAPLAPCA
jgi:hypothetical protein